MRHSPVRRTLRAACCIMHANVLHAVQPGALHVACCVHGARAAHACCVGHTRACPHAPPTASPAARRRLSVRSAAPLVAANHHGNTVRHVGADGTAD
jgi:hypothetical protein